ncbi:hypothetical protein LVD17_15170 [Fulvivirga ulvae]|uniref:hypothetical protein n=1 Tax=Fulvivirga ulvae TaxID=2904245 RepID=UPI001F234435|nr:hypothetical protein [Fulvivirga ulvae]UII29640.1 hypothetical protein LVD17_15170 [Fulvivirga ulvae]
MTHDNSIIYSKKQIEETTSGLPLSFWDLENYNVYRDGDLQSFEGTYFGNYLLSTKEHAKYYPIAELLYTSQTLSIFITIEENEEQISALYLSVSKNNKLTSELDLWNLAGLTNVKGLSNSIKLDAGVLKDQPYTITVFSTNYPDGYYLVKVLLNGKIEVKQVELQEGAIP